MLREFTLAAVLCAVSAPSLAFLRCVDENGDFTYTNGNVCPDGLYGDRVEVNEAPPPAAGLRPAEMDMLRSIERREANDRARRGASRDRKQRNSLTYSDRLRVRELEMKKGQLSGSVKNSNSWSQNYAIEGQIRGIDRQIEQIRAPKY